MQLFWVGYIGLHHFWTSRSEAAGGLKSPPSPESPANSPDEPPDIFFVSGRSVTGQAPAAHLMGARPEKVSKDSTLRLRAHLESLLGSR
jgi:hypothetical protein